MFSFCLAVFIGLCVLLLFCRVVLLVSVCCPACKLLFPLLIRQPCFKPPPPPTLCPLIWPHELFCQSRLSCFEVDETIYHRRKTYQLPALKDPYLCPAPAAGHRGSGTSQLISGISGYTKSCKPLMHSIQRYRIHPKQVMWMGKGAAMTPHPNSFLYLPHPPAFTLPDRLDL